MRSRLIAPPLLSLCVAAAAGCSTPELSGPELAPSRPLAARAVPTNIQIRQPVSFTIPAGTCGLATTVEGTGEFHIVIQFTQRPDGTFNPAPINATSNGTAVGADGSRYHWTYTNNSILRDRTGGFSFPFTVQFVDVFRLTGAGNAPDIKVTQRGTITITGPNPEDFTVLSYSVKGDPACDPI
jgi:hypothetical protein